jgi:hypothetical protein
MKTLLPLILIIAVAVSCSRVPEEVSSNEQNPIATVTVGETFAPSKMSTNVPTQTPIPTILVTAKPSLTLIPSPTLPPDCGVRKLGKAGTQTEESSHSVLIEGTAILCNHGSLYEEFPTSIIPLREAMFDLDTGLSIIESADIGFGVYGTMRFYDISPLNNALVSIWSLNGLTSEHPPQPTFEECKEQVTNYRNDNEPEYVCVITNEGHIARIKVEKYNPVQQISSIEISFITWDKQIEKP